MTLASSTFPETWRFVRLKSPLGELWGSVVEADDDVLGVAWDLNPQAADVRALGEAVERSALHNVPDTIVRGSARSLGDRAIDLRDRVTFTPDQRASDARLATFGWDDTTECTWTPMQSPTGEQRLVPVDLARIRLSGGDLLRPKPMTSIGTACGDSWDSAMSRALTEVVERHAIALAVYHRSRAVRVDPHDSGAGDIADALGADAELWVGMLPSGPFGREVAVAAVLGREDGMPQAAFGTAASSSAEHAVRSAALEAVHIFHLGWRLLKRGTPLGEPTTINQRALWWATHGRVHVGDYFTEDGQPRPLSRSERHPERWQADSEWLAAELSRAGHDWAWADITPAWSSGVFVARVVAPSLLHLQINEFPFLVAPRFPSAVEAFGRAAADSAGIPHPFV